LSRTSYYYDFIRVDSTRRGRIPESLFTPRTVLKGTHLLELYFTTLSETHVSTGCKEVKENTVPEIIMLQYRNHDGIPVIPGSTLKGVLSTNYLALTGSIALTSELFGSDRHPAISKVFFEDATPTKPTETVLAKVDWSWGPRRRLRNSVKFYHTRAPQTKFYGYAQCIPKGTELKTTIQATGLKNFELGGLILSLGVYPKNEGATGTLKVGYGKPQGFGQLKIIPEKSNIKAVDFKTLTKTIHSIGTLQEPPVKEYVEKFLKKIKKRDPKRNIDQIFQKLFKRV